MLIFLLIILIALFIFLFWLFSERGKLILPSTKKAFKIGGLNLKTLHAYIYARFAKMYIGDLIKYIFPYSPRWFKKTIANRYHSKVLTTKQAEAIIHLDHDLAHHNHEMEKIIPFPMARDLILNGPPDVAIYECSCRHNRQKPCLPTRVCMIVGQPFVDFIIEHRPEESQRINQKEAVEILRAEHLRGHIHTAWFKDLLQDRFFVICNCCRCCCGGIEAMMKHHLPIMVSSGYSALVDKNKCAGCGLCVQVCPFSASKLENKKSQIDREKCMGCGVCVDKCPEKAITLELDETKPAPLNVNKL